MIVSFDPASPEQFGAVQSTMPAGCSPWSVVDGQPLRAWIPNPGRGEPWFLGQVPMIGAAWIEIPDGMGHIRSCHAVAALIRIPDPCDADEVARCAVPPPVATMADAEACRREMARRTVALRGALGRAQRPHNTIPAWMPGPS